ncbi:MAG: peptidoglycan editing factor PgeF [Tissierellia bacterium]|mgnify:CR=1 FL=1|nr:peptidoglycan editing factor PgeF [Tissierellia bacterium]
MNIIERYDRDILYYEFQELKKISFVNHLFSSKIGWNSENIIENISKIFNVSKSNVLYLTQIHSNHIEIIDEKTLNYGKILGKEGDGLITDLSNIVLMTYHADCVPIYFLDKEKRVVGLAHGGWRGSFENISGNMIRTFIEKFNSNPKDILVAIGPSIGPCCYEISKELGDKFIKKYNDFQDILIKRDSSIYLDLWKLNYLQVRKMGILDENIISSNACTSCNIDKFYSYRKEATQDRMVAAISLS